MLNPVKEGEEVIRYRPGRLKIFENFLLSIKCRLSDYCISKLKCYSLTSSRVSLRKPVYSGHPAVYNGHQWPFPKGDCYIQD